MLVEPMFLTTPAGAAFAGVMAPLIDRYQAGDAEGAVHGFLALVGDRNWYAIIEQTVPGGIAQAVKDVATFFETEVPRCRRRSRWQQRSPPSCNGAVGAPP